MKSSALSNTASAVALPLRWKPVNTANLKEPPHPWPLLLQAGFNELLYDRVRRYWTSVVEDGNEEWLRGPIVALGESFDKKFEPSNYPHAHYGAFCTGKWLDGINVLANELPLISPIMWDTIASLGARENPLEEDTILNVQGELPYAWGLCDAALHALGKTYELFLHVEERLREHSGYVLMHNCGCSHALQDVLEVQGRFPLIQDSDAIRFKMSKAWLDHFMSELHLMFVSGYPFRMNPEDFNSTKVIAFKQS